MRKMSSDITRQPKTAHSAKYEVKILADLDNKITGEIAVKQNFSSERAEPRRN